MKLYEIIYYKKNGDFTHKKTDTFQISEVNASKKMMRYHSNWIHGKKFTLKSDTDWTDYINCGYEKSLSETELFMLLL